MVLGPRHVDMDLVLGVHWWGLQTAPGRLDPVRDLLRGREWYAHSRGVLDGDPTHLGGRPGVSGGLAFEEPLRNNHLTAFYGIAARVIDRRSPGAAVIGRRSPALIADFVGRDLQASPVGHMVMWPTSAPITEGHMMMWPRLQAADRAWRPYWACGRWPHGNVATVQPSGCFAAGPDGSRTSKQADCRRRGRNASILLV